MPVLDYLGPFSRRDNLWMGALLDYREETSVMGGLVSFFLSKQSFQSPSSQARIASIGYISK